MSKLYVDEIHPKTSGGVVTMPTQIAFKAHGNNAAYVDTTPIPFPNVKLRKGQPLDSKTFPVLISS